MSALNLPSGPGRTRHRDARLRAAGRRRRPVDGLPRTVAEADALDDALQREGRAITAAILIDVPDQMVVEPIAGRLHAQTAPLAAYYEERGLLVTVDGTGTPDEVGEAIATALASASPRRWRVRSRSTSSTCRLWVRVRPFPEGEDEWWLLRVLAYSPIVGGLFGARRFLGHGMLGGRRNFTSTAAPRGERCDVRGRVH